MSDEIKEVMIIKGMTGEEIDHVREFKVAPNTMSEDGTIESEYISH